MAREAIKIEIKISNRNHSTACRPE